MFALPYLAHPGNSFPALLTIFIPAAPEPSGPLPLFIDALRFLNAYKKNS